MIKNKKGKNYSMQFSPFPPIKLTNPYLHVYS